MRELGVIPSEASASRKELKPVSYVDYQTGSSSVEYEVIRVYIETELQAGLAQPFSSQNKTENITIKSRKDTTEPKSWALVGLAIRIAPKL